MGLIEKFKSNYDYYKVDKFTKRRSAQSQFESHDRQYYEQVYRDGVYLTPDDASSRSSSPSQGNLKYKSVRWSLPGLFRKSSNKKPFSSTNQLRTSEAYTLGYTRE